MKAFARIVMMSVLFSCSALTGSSQSNQSPLPAGQSSAGAEKEALGEVDKLLKGNVALGINAPVVLSSRGQPEGAPKSSETIEGHIVKHPQPEYPARAKAVRAQGTVAVKVMIDEKGKVIAAQIETGHPLLRASALKAAREAEFTPIVFKGQPVKIVGVILYNFTLQ